MRLQSLLILLLLTACDESDVAIGPTGPTLPPPTTTAPIEPEPIDRGVPFSWDDTRGLLIFAGTQATEAQIVGLHNGLKSRAWPTITYNVCSETTDWKGTLWAVGPDAFSRENLDNLRRFLKVTAELGDQVRLNIFCTLRDNKNWMSKNAEKYIIKVVDIVKEFDHVTLSIGNEIQHRDSWFKNHNTRIRIARDWIRLAGFQGLIGADDNIGCANPDFCSFKYQYAGLGFVPDFHPWRNRDPGPGAMREIVRVNGLPTVFSETTCYSRWRNDPLCTTSQEQILLYMRRAEREGIVFFFHSTDGLQWPTKVSHFDWIPS